MKINSTFIWFHIGTKRIKKNKNKNEISYKTNNLFNYIRIKKCFSLLYCIFQIKYFRLFFYLIIIISSLKCT